MQEKQHTIGIKDLSHGPKLSIGRISFYIRSLLKSHYICSLILFLSPAPIDVVITWASPSFNPADCTVPFSTAPELWMSLGLASKGDLRAYKDSFTGTWRASGS